MTLSIANKPRFGADTRTFHGTFPERLAAIRRAGFAQVMLWRSDLEEYPDGVDAACEIVKASGLSVTGMQLIRDVDSGLTGERRSAKFEEAASICRLARCVGAPLVLCCSSVDERADPSTASMVADLRALADIAEAHQVAIAYEALSWGTHIHDVASAAALVERVNHPALGLAIDTFHLIARHTPIEVLHEIDPHRVFLVQLADCDTLSQHSNAERLNVARHHRHFPGVGAHGAFVEAVISTLHARGYQGAFSLEVFNDAFNDLPDDVVAHLAFDTVP